MKRMCWKDGWHVIDENLEIYIEGGEIRRGIKRTNYGFWTICFPYIKVSDGYDIKTHMKANKKNFMKQKFF